MPLALQLARQTHGAVGNDFGIHQQAIFPITRCGAGLIREKAQYRASLADFLVSSSAQRRTIAGRGVQFFHLAERHRALYLAHPRIERDVVVVGDWISVAVAFVDEQEHAARERFGSSVTTRPPSPQVMCLPCCRLKQPMVPNVADILAVVLREKCLRASSMTGRLCFSRQRHESDPYRRDFRTDA